MAAPAPKEGKYKTLIKAGPGAKLDNPAVTAAPPLPPKAAKPKRSAPVITSTTVQESVVLPTSPIAAPPPAASSDGRVDNCNPIALRRASLAGVTTNMKATSISSPGAAANATTTTSVLNATNAVSETTDRATEYNSPQNDVEEIVLHSDPDIASHQTVANRRRLSQLQQLLGGNESMCDRVLIHEGEVQKFNRSNKFEKHLFILTADALMYCTASVLGEKMKLDRIIPLNTILAA